MAQSSRCGAAGEGSEHVVLQATLLSPAPPHWLQPEQSPRALSFSVVF